MFDAAFFSESLPAHSVEMHGATAIIRLTTGETFCIQKVIATDRNILTLATYPADNTIEERRKRKNPATGDVIYDRLVVPYGLIATVFLTLDRPEETRLGFATST